MRKDTSMLIAILALCACQTAEVPGADPDAERPASLGQTSIAADIPRISRQARDSLLGDSDPYRLDSARMEGDSLAIYLSVGGGCGEHIFSLYQSEYVYESYPPGVDLWIHHDGGEDHCLALMGRRLASAADRFRPAYPGGFVFIGRHPGDSGEAVRVDLPVACSP